jgi:putative membrane protein
MKTSTLVLTCLTALTFTLAPVSRAWADVASSDKTFVKKAAVGGMAEVDMGKMAEEKGSSQDVKDFGAMMVKDHTANNDDLAALAKTKGLMVPDKLDSMHQKIADKLSAMSGADFDKAYINDMVMGHTKMLALMKSEESSSDPDLKSFATKTSDTVQMHLDKAKALQSSMK